ncbi:MAG TPA: phosphoadenosine phosphosulfate reductase family protein, partial [Rhodanobacteraceae bacterium]
MNVARLHTHLDRLEAESIRILRETAAECRKPVLLYSIGKDSSVLLHLLLKAFYPARPPLPMLHVNTTWKFREMIEFRDRVARETGVELIEHINQDGVRQGTDPVHAASKHTYVMKTL